MKYSGFFLFVFLLFISCAKEQSQLPKKINEEIIDPTTDADFYFFPTKNAKWVIRTVQQGVAFNDTFSLGKDTQIVSRTMNLYSNFFPDADPPSLKNYQEILYHEPIVTPSNELIINLKRHGWFRQDSVNRRIYSPHFNVSYQMIYDYLGYEFGLDIGDTCHFTSQSGMSTMIVKAVGSVKFGNKNLRTISYGPPVGTSIVDKITEVLYFSSYNLTSGSMPHSGTIVNRIFCHKNDTIDDN